MNTPTFFSLLAVSLLSVTGCSAHVEGDGEAKEESSDALSPCATAVPDRTAESLSSIPFQSLDRGSLPATIGSIAWGYPTESRSVPNNFGAGRSYNEGHEGADIGGRQGDGIHAAAAGEVAYVLSSCPNNNTGRDRVCGNGWGKHVVVRHQGNVYTRYAHLRSVAVNVGDAVARGQRVGVMGISGLSDGPHLHFELGARAADFKVCSAPQNFDKVYNPAKLAYDATPAPAGASRCESATHSRTPYSYRVTDTLRLQVFGADRRMVADLAATPKNGARATLNGQAVELLYDARSGTGAGLFVYKALADGRTYLKHDGQGDLVPMTCR